MRVGYQGEPGSYSHLAAGELFPDGERIGFASFPAAFAAFDEGLVDLLCLPIENSTTGSILPVLDRLLHSGLAITREHLVEVRHALLAIPGTTVDQIKQVWSHPEALSQAARVLAAHGWEPEPAHDTAGAVRLVAERADPSIAALARADAAADHGLEVLIENVVDHQENTTRFVVLEAGPPTIADDADKSTLAFSTSHTPGALALALTELGLRGANLTRIESRPTEDAWHYRFYVDLMHPAGEAGFRAVLEPTPATITDVHHLGSYRSVLH